MGTVNEIAALNWFLAKYPNRFQGITAESGTLQEDYAGIDAWLMKDGKKQVSVGIRRHGPQEIYREFTIRIQQKGVPWKRFELAKLVDGGGPQFYLQIWEDDSLQPVEWVFVSVKRMRAAGCFDLAHYLEFWSKPYLFKTSGTLWAKMDIERLFNLPGNCVILADIHDRVVHFPELDQMVNGDKPILHFRKPKKG